MGQTEALNLRLKLGSQYRHHARHHRHHHYDDSDDDSSSSDAPLKREDLTPARTRSSDPYAGLQRAMTVGEVEHQRNDAVMPHVDRSRIAGGRQEEEQNDDNSIIDITNHGHHRSSRPEKESGTQMVSDDEFLRIFNPGKAAEHKVQVGSDGTFSLSKTFSNKEVHPKFIGEEPGSNYTGYQLGPPPNATAGPSASSMFSQQQLQHQPSTPNEATGVSQTKVRYLDEAADESALKASQNARQQQQQEKVMNTGAVLAPEAAKQVSFAAGSTQVGTTMLSASPPDLTPEGSPISIQLAQSASSAPKPATGAVLSAVPAANSAVAVQPAKTPVSAGVPNVNAELFAKFLAWAAANPGVAAAVGGSTTAVAPAALPAAATVASTPAVPAAATPVATPLAAPVTLQAQQAKVTFAVPQTAAVAVPVAAVAAVSPVAPATAAVPAAAVAATATTVPGPKAAVLTAAGGVAPPAVAAIPKHVPVDPRMAVLSVSPPVAPAAPAAPASSASVVTAAQQGITLASVSAEQHAANTAQVASPAITPATSPVLTAAPLAAALPAVPAAPIALQAGVAAQPLTAAQAALLQQFKSFQLQQAQQLTAKPAPAVPAKF
eukprot:CAMPEP_0175177286 /NCGR_PEP_ID=MMETSP0087-20121206/34299_1 /TAXON_ID=136419 /ORGANISM="Unknown Unknown, Strain D1" /LENGTH=604 /DNA_ID=CAMNT_0016469241 /DNA_START=55 /DNA_END=1869 /DNA_ORIENTATION=+